MNLSWLAVNATSALLLPPLNLVLVLIAAWLMHRRWPRLANALGLLAVTALVVFSTLAGSRLLTAPLERMVQPLEAPERAQAQAIVVLGAGRLRSAPEYGGQDVPSLAALARLRYGAALHRKTGLPLLVTGGRPDGASTSEAALMAAVLREDFSVPVKWLEPDSDNTAQNAQYSARLLKQAGAQRILLVTDAIHMPRAQAVFLQYGLDVVPAPTTFVTRAPIAPHEFVPGAIGFARSHYGLHEWIGLLWYRLRHGTS